MNNEQRLCKRCLVRDMDNKQMYHTMYEYISHLDEEIKASPEVYESRLAICKGCERLLEGMCNACGCYVELRAAIRIRVCPYEKW